MKDEFHREKETSEEVNEDRRNYAEILAEMESKENQEGKAPEAADQDQGFEEEEKVQQEEKNMENNDVQEEEDAPEEEKDQGAQEDQEMKEDSPEYEEMKEDSLEHEEMKEEYPEYQEEDTSKEETYKNDLEEVHRDEMMDATHEEPGEDEDFTNQVPLFVEGEKAPEEPLDKTLEEDPKEKKEKSNKQKKKDPKKKKRNTGGKFSLKIGNKIALGFFLVIAIFGILSFQTWRTYNDLEDSILDANRAAETYNNVAQLDAELWRQYGYIFEYAILQREETLESYEGASQRFDQLFEDITGVIEAPEILEELDRINILKGSMENVLYEGIVPSIGTDREDFQDRRLTTVEGRIRNIGEAFAIVNQHIQQETEAIIEEAEGVIATEQRQLILFLGIALAIAIAVTVILTRGISKPLKELQEEAEKVSKGDLTLDFNGSGAKDEIGELSRSFGRMSQNLKTLITSVKEASEKATQSSEILMETAKQSSGASEDLSKTILEIAETADNQAQNTTEGTEKVNEMASTIENVSKSTLSLKKSAENTERLREQGVKVVDNLFEKTETIHQVTGEVSKIIQETDANTEKINKASIVIHSISEQTGLLALNAAIESARAGEAGRGFAVVAEEIRKLADQASKSTKEIEDIVKLLKEKSSIAVRDMKNLEGTIEDQGEAVEETKGIFNDLSDAIYSTKEETQGVESYVDVMLGKKDEIVDVINQLASIAEENAASTEEASAATEEQTASMEEIQSASEQLTNLSYELMEVVGEFKV